MCRTCPRGTDLPLGQEAARKKHLPECVLSISHLLPAGVVWDPYFLVKKHRRFRVRSWADIPRARDGDCLSLGNSCPFIYTLVTTSVLEAFGPHLCALCTEVLGTTPTLVKHGAPGPQPDPCTQCVDSNLPELPWGADSSRRLF